jgi:hypothetical protein
MRRRHLQRISWHRDHRSGQSGVTHRLGLRRSSLLLCLHYRCTILRSTETRRLRRRSRLPQNECTRCAGRTVGGLCGLYSTTQRLQMIRHIRWTEAPVRNLCLAYTAGASVETVLIRHVGLSFVDAFSNWPGALRRRRLSDAILSMSVSPLWDLVQYTDPGCTRDYERTPPARQFMSTQTVQRALHRDSQ